MAKQPIRLCKVCQGEVKYSLRPSSPYCSKKCEASVEGYSEQHLRANNLKDRLAGTTAWRPNPLETTINIVTPNPVLVIGDIHCPLIDEKWAHQALIAARRFECKHVVINGDLVDATTISRHLGGEYRRRSEFNDDIESANKFLQILCDEFDSISYTLGNHTQRMLLKFMGEVSLKNMMMMISSHEKFRATEKHFLKINNAVTCLHPRSYSRVRGKLTQDLAQRYQTHLVTSHHHHTASTISADGKWQAVEIGCLAKIELFGYAQYAMHGMPEMANGFGIVMPESEKHAILNFNNYTPWRVYGLPPI